MEVKNVSTDMRNL